MIFEAVGPAAFYHEHWTNYGLDQNSEAAAGLFSVMSGKEIGKCYRVSTIIVPPCAAEQPTGDRYTSNTKGTPYRACVLPKRAHRRVYGVPRFYKLEEKTTKKLTISRH